MTTPRILRSPEARRDLLDIWAYIADKSSPSIADGFLARLSGAMEVIAYAPHIGRERSEFHGSPRSVAVNPYVIFYEPLAEGDGILVWRVIHGRRELSRLVRDPRR
ncbi:MAG TPA: type II toxin-antitoxin system RelE/ParE family toxin [Rhizomicrobium sp.]